MQIFFWVIFILIVYAYAGYPVLLAACAGLFKKRVNKKPFWPKISVVMSAFNEERNIERKLRNLLSLDYPQDKMEILIGSDGAWDKTDEIISRFPSDQVRFFKFVKNQGKTSILNSLVREARGTILVFTDVRQDFDARALRELAANFSDPRVGCVSGELFFRQEMGGRGESAESGTSKGMGAYWNYEKFLRKKESEAGSMLGATGAIYAIRRKFFRPMPADILVDDMFIPLSVIEQGYRAIFEPEAKAYDTPSETGVQEFKRKVRTLAGNYQIFTYFRGLFNPFKSPVAWQFFSHKLLRVLIPFFLILLMVVNLFLVLHPFYLGFFIAQVFFYGMAAVEAFHTEGKRRGIAYLPYMFCLLNYSAFVGFFRYLKGETSAAWEKAYE